MGELLLCNESIASLPYYIDGISLNIYSLEELNYYIVENTFLLDKGFMNEELCTWVSKEMKLPKLAENLREIMHSNGRLSKFVELLLQAGAYCTAKEKQEVLFVLKELEEKSEFECNKIRADRLMEKEKYLSSIYEYRRLLNSTDALHQNAILIGTIWHNLGTAYARMFLFEEAAKCYENAYQKNQKQESLRSCLFAYRCIHDELGFVQTAQKYLIDEDGMQSLREELTALSRSENTIAFEEGLDAIIALNLPGSKAQYQKEIGDIIFRWKEDYRNNCKM